MSKQDRDEAIDRVGRMLFGPAWIGEVTQEEWALGRQYVGEHGKLLAPFPDSVKEATAAARAALHCYVSEIQNAQVFSWLTAQGIECAPDRFSSTDFENWFKPRWGDAENSATARRRASVRKLLPERDKMTMPEFCDAVFDDCGLSSDERTIRRDIAAILAGP
jgi:hypothetical protein